MRPIMVVNTVFAVLIFASVAIGAIPSTINYQGYLKNTDGTPVNTTVPVVFSIYTASTGGSAVWTETRNVTPANGIYSVQLGDVTPFPANLFANDPLYLGVTVGSDPEMTPRQQLNSAPYAMRAGCNPGDMIACYTGDMATLNTGLCKSGIRTCNTFGSGFGVCVGEITPNCSNKCADLAADLNNCGTCGRICSFPNATAVCTAGVCGMGTCNANFDNCDTNPVNGCETNLLNSVNNCGACGTVCALANATSVCASGACGIGTCNTNYGNCDANPVNGCETYLLSSVNNCGTCGKVCSFPNAASVCTSGVCGMGTCNVHYADCNGFSGDGCEIDTSTSALHCGSCGHACPTGANASPICSFGSCGIACNADYGNCDGNSANGCEASLTTVTHCGSCGVTCPASTSCTTYACTNKVCTPTYLSGSPCPGGTCDSTGNCIPPTPTVSSLSPNSGLSTASTTNVKINGSNFTVNTVIKIGTTALPSASCVYNSSSRITCTIPGTGDGSVFGQRDVIADNGSGVTGTLNNGWRYIGVLNETNLPLEADWCNIQFPATITGASGTQVDVFGRIFEEGITDAIGPSANTKAQFGYGPGGTNPISQPDGWIYLDAAYSNQVSVNDEYFASVTIPAPGSYNYVVRFSLDNGASYTYCDTDGAGSNSGLVFSMDMMGVMTAQ